MVDTARWRSSSPATPFRRPLASRLMLRTSGDKTAGVSKARSSGSMSNPSRGKYRTFPASSSAIHASFAVAAFQSDRSSSTSWVSIGKGLLPLSDGSGKLSVHLLDRNDAEVVHVLHAFDGRFGAE